jgi:predicted metal-dependent peptidase
MMAESVNNFPIVSKAKARLLMNHPFFATLLLNSPIVVDETTCPLAATDMKNIYLNPNFLKTLSIEDLMTVLCHEVGHNALLHGPRLEGRNHDLWNQAGDHAINLMLEDQGFRPPACGWLADKKYKGWSAEKIYDDLRKQAQDGGGGSGSDPMHGDLLPVAGAGDPAQRAETVRRMKQKVAQAATAAKLAGKLKGDLATMIEDFLDPKVPWPDVLRDFLLRIVKDDESWTRRNRRFSKVYLPARHSEKMGPIVIIGDSSGSIWCSPEDLKMFATEIQAVADQVQPEHIRLIWADTAVAGEEVFEQGQPLKFDVKGGGGTDMRVPLQYVEQYEPEVVILLTDGYTPWPAAEPPYPLIVCCSTDVDCPVGQVIRL